MLPKHLRTLLRFFSPITLSISASIFRLSPFLIIFLSVLLVFENSKFPLFDSLAIYLYVFCGFNPVYIVSVFATTRLVSQSIETIWSRLKLLNSEMIFFSSSSSYFFLFCRIRSISTLSFLLMRIWKRNILNVYL